MLRRPDGVCTALDFRNADIAKYANAKMMNQGRYMSIAVFIHAYGVSRMTIPPSLNVPPLLVTINPSPSCGANHPANGTINLAKSNQW
jgi:hypothetical protein